MKKVIYSFLSIMLISTVSQGAVAYPTELDEMPTAEQRSQFEASFDSLRKMFETIKILERDVWVTEKGLPLLDSEINRARFFGESAKLSSLEKNKENRLNAVQVYNRLAGYYRILINDTRRAFGMLGIEVGLRPLSPTPGRFGTRKVEFATDVHGVFTSLNNDPISAEELESLAAARERLKSQIPPFRRLVRLQADAVVEVHEVIPTLQSNGSLIIHHADGTFTSTEPDVDLADLYQRGVADEEQALEEKAAKDAINRIKKANQARREHPLVRGLASVMTPQQLPAIETDVDRELLTMKTLSVEEEETIRDIGISIFQERDRKKGAPAEERRKRRAEERKKKKAEKTRLTEIDTDEAYSGTIRSVVVDADQAFAGINTSAAYETDC